MNTLRKRRFALKLVCSSLFSAGMLALPGTAGAITPVITVPDGGTDFCTLYSYDNALVPDPGQQTGLFTDIRRGNDISADYPNCQLNLTGSTGSAGDMWITLLRDHGPDGVEGGYCPSIRAEVLIKRFDNRKAVGFVSHYNSGDGTGLFLGLYDNGNTDGLTLSTFDADTGRLTGTVAHKPLGSKIQENVWYILRLEVCVGANITGSASVNGGPVPISESLPINGPNTAGIVSFGEIGIAGYAKSSFVDSSVRNFSWDDLD